MNDQNDTQTDIYPFKRYQVADAFGRLITFYISRGKLCSESLPLCVFIQGSGCHSVFRLNKSGQVRGGYQSLLQQVAQTRVITMIVEKPGVEFLSDPGSRGVATHCSKEFLEEHTLHRWTVAIGTALKAALQLTSNVSLDKLLAIGHSEGGIVAAHLAAEFPMVSHIAILSSSGPTQLFDLAEAARNLVSQGESIEERDRRVYEVYETFAKIQADPESILRFAWEHPFRRWSSFLATSTLDELLRSQAQVYVAHGSDDRTIPIAAFEVLRTELIRHGRKITAERFEGADHSFYVKDHSVDPPMSEIFQRILNWFMETPSP
jgi:pimeloyl-ACP methyl ester carboxylesterase